MSMRLEKGMIEAFFSSHIVKYCGVGVFVNGIGYALFLLLTFAGLNHNLSASFTYFLGVLASFVLNRSLVFKSKVTWKLGFLRFCIMLFLGYVLNISMLYIGVDVLYIPASVVQLISIVCVSVFFYFSNKLFVHRGI